MNKLIKKLCGNCHGTAEYICSRCNVEVYCSKSCQINDFTRHRTECFHLPALKVIDEHLNRSTLVQTSTPDCTDMQPSKTEDKCSDNIDLTKISSPSKSTVSLSNEGKKNTEVQNILKKNVNDGRSVKKIDENERVTRNAVQEEMNIATKMNEKTKSQVTPAFEQGFHTPPPNMYNRTKSNVSILKTKQENGNEVKETNRFSLEKHRQNHPTMLANMPIKETRVFRHDLKARKLSVKNKHKICLLSGNINTKIFYALENFTGVEEYLDHINDNIKEFLAKDKTISYMPLKNEMVLAKFDDVYYRACCEEIVAGKTNSYKMLFVDYGNTEEITDSDIKPFGPKLKNEIILHKVFIENMPSAEKITDEINKILSDQNGMFVDILNEENNVYHARICGI